MNSFLQLYSSRGKKPIPDIAQTIYDLGLSDLWDSVASFYAANTAAFVGGTLSSPSDLIISPSNNELEDGRGFSIFASNWFDTPDANGDWSGFGTSPPDNGEDSDVVYVIVWNETKDLFGFDNNSTRVIGGWSIPPFPQNFESGDVCHAWLCFTRPDFSLISDTEYATGTV